MRKPPFHGLEVPEERDRLAVLHPAGVAGAAALEGEGGAAPAGRQVSASESATSETRAAVSRPGAGRSRLSPFDHGLLRAARSPSGPKVRGPMSATVSPPLPPAFEVDAPALVTSRCRPLAHALARPSVGEDERHDLAAGGGKGGRPAGGATAGGAGGVGSAGEVTVAGVVQQPRRTAPSGSETRAEKPAGPPPSAESRHRVGAASSRDHRHEIRRRRPRPSPIDEGGRAAAGLLKAAVESRLLRPARIERRERRRGALDPKAPLRLVAAADENGRRLGPHGSGDGEEQDGRRSMEHGPV